MAVLDASDFPTDGQNLNTDMLLPDVDRILNGMKGMANRQMATPQRTIHTPPAPPPSPTILNTKGMPGQNIVPDFPKGAPSAPWHNSIPQPSFACKTDDVVTFFKDPVGNQYKTVGEKLYVLGWQDANVKIRMVNSSNGKEVKSDGKKFQIYGWHLVSKMTKAEDVDKVKSMDDVSRIVSEIKAESSIVPPAESPNTDYSAELGKSNHKRAKRIL